MAEALTRHIAPEAASFIQVVFGLHNEAELRELMTGAGFRSVVAQVTSKRVGLLRAPDFLWQYVSSTRCPGWSPARPKTTASATSAPAGATLSAATPSPSTSRSPPSSAAPDSVRRPSLSER